MLNQVDNEARKCQPVALASADANDESSGCMMLIDERGDTIENPAMAAKLVPSAKPEMEATADKHVIAAERGKIWPQYR